MFIVRYRPEWLDRLISIDSLRCFSVLASARIDRYVYCVLINVLNHLHRCEKCYIKLLALVVDAFSSCSSVLWDVLLAEIVLVLLTNKIQSIYSIPVQLQ